MDPDHKLDIENEPTLSDQPKFKSLIGKQLYLTRSKSNFTFFIYRLSQYCEKLTNIHMLTIIRMLRYIKKEHTKGIFFQQNSTLTLTGFIDLDWGGCPTTQRLITRFTFFLGSNFISWKKKKQTVVSQSSSEAEYRVLASTSYEAQWLIYLL